MKKKLFSFFLALTLAFCGRGVLADGMVIYQPDPYSGGWDYSDESDQRAYINYQNGLEKMVVSVNIDGVSDKNAVWLFPVPASPEKVVIDVVDELPEMYGVEVSSKAERGLSEIKDFLFGSQIYPILSALFGNRDYRYSGMDDMGMAAGLSKNEAPNMMAESDVTVYEHLDKKGLSTEIITAKTAAGIYDYFEGKGLKVEKGMIPALDAYIGKDYSFVVSWINNGVTANKGIMVDDWANRQDRQYIQDNLESYLGIPVIQAKLYDLKKSYPVLEVETDRNLSFQVDGDQVVSYLRSDEGSAAMDKLAAAIQADTTLDGTVIGGEAAPVDDWNSNSSAAGVSYGSPSSQVIAPGYPYDYWSEYYPASDGPKGVLVYFPTDDIYFPLLPTSVYDSKTVPATIKVAGYVDPRIYGNIDNFTKVSYFTDAYSASGGSEIQDNFFGDTNLFNYTKIEINAPSKYLTEDLWMRDRAPMAALYPAFFADYPDAVKFILLVLCSLAAAFIAGMVLLKDLRQKPGKIALLGLANCLSLIGLIAAAFHIGGSSAITKENAALLEKIKAKGYSGKRKRALIYFVAAVLSLLLMVLSASGLVTTYYSLGYYVSYQLEALVGLVFLYLPPVLAFLGWRAAQVAPEDKQLFADLKAKGYSTWSFKPGNRNPWLFIGFFSVTFLLLAALSVWLLGLGLK